MNQNQKIITTEKDIELLQTYCVLLYGTKKSAELISEFQDNLFGKNGLSYYLGKQSLEFFCLYYLQNIFRSTEDNCVRHIAPFHFEIWQNLQSMFLENQFDKLELLMPRGSSKTTTCDIALSVWLHCYGISDYTLVLGKTEQDAQQFVRSIKMELQENKYIRNTFGNLITKTAEFIINSCEVELNNHTKIQAISSTSSVRGKTYNGHRPTCIIADDYQGLSDVITQEARDKKYNTWINDVEKAGDKAVYISHARRKMLKKPATKFIVLGTLLHRDCFMSRLKKDLTYHHIEKKAILLDDIDEYFGTGLWKEFHTIYTDRKRTNQIEDAKAFYDEHYDEMQYSVLWADKYDCLDLAIEYYQSPTSFKQEYQNDVDKIGEKYFHDIHTFTDEELADHKQNGNIKYTILCCDPAVGTANHNDYSAFVVASKDNNNFRWMQKGIIAKLTYDSYLNQIISLLKAYPEIKMLWVEKNVFSGADVRDLKIRINADEDLKKRNLEIINEHQNKNKENKIQAITGKVDSGYILFNENDTEFIEQIKQFAGVKYSAHDDAPDIVSEADRLLTVTKQTPEIKLYKVWK